MDIRSARNIARITGVLYLIIIICGIFSEMFVRGNLKVKGDMAGTVANIVASEQLFRLGIGAELIMLVCDVAVALTLYNLLRSVNKHVALLAAFLRLMHASIYGITLLNLVFVLKLSTGTFYLNGFSPEQLQALAGLFLDGHHYGYLLGLTFFGFDCLVVGYLVVRSSYFPNILGFLIIIAGFGYLSDSFANFLMPQYARFSNFFMLVVAIPALVGEVSFCLFLLIKGVRRNITEEGIKSPAG